MIPCVWPQEIAKALPSRPCVGRLSSPHRAWCTSQCLAVSGRSCSQGLSPPPWGGMLICTPSPRDLLETLLGASAEMLSSHPYWNLFIGGRGCLDYDILHSDSVFSIPSPFCLSFLFLPPPPLQLHKNCKAFCSVLLCNETQLSHQHCMPPDPGLVLVHGANGRVRSQHYFLFWLLIP